MTRIQFITFDPKNSILFEEDGIVLVNYGGLEFSTSLGSM